jgi:splicing factor 3A subunit 3
MADTSPLEAHRATHEEAERLESALVDTLLAAGSTHREALRRAHRASSLLDALTARHAALAALYADADGVRRAELARIDDGGADLGGFYERLAALRAYHAKYPGAAPDAFSVPPPPAPVPGVLDEVDRLFSGEEAGGRFLDLATHHTRFINLKGVRRMPYLRFLAELAAASSAASVPHETKRSESYKKCVAPHATRDWYADIPTRYLDDLNLYLLSFLRNTRPLADVDYLELSALADFEETWEQRAVPGWEDWGESVWGKSAAAAPAGEESGAKEGVWCEACELAAVAKHRVGLPWRRRRRSFHLAQASGHSPSRPCTTAISRAQSTKKPQPG